MKEALENLKYLGVRRGEDRQNPMKQKVDFVNSPKFTRVGEKKKRELNPT